MKMYEDSLRDKRFDKKHGGSETGRVDKRADMLGMLAAHAKPAVKKGRKRSKLDMLRQAVGK